MKTIYLIITIALLLHSCRSGKDEADAYGNFEAIDVLVGAEAQGKLLVMNPTEGQIVKKGEELGLIDTIQLYLKKEQLKAQYDASATKTSMLVAQIAVYNEQKSTALKEKSRFEQLVKEEAAPAKQLDDIKGQLNVIDKQIASVNTQHQAIYSELRAIKLQIAQINDQIKKSIITSPIDGTVLEKYIEQGEIVAPGKALFKVANMNKISLRAYVSGDQLASFKLGQKVKVRIDIADDQMKEYEGTIAWVSEQSEFTPKIIQTRDERVNLVYAVKVDVVNDGAD